MSKKKFCPQCGNQVNENAKFCPHCGANLEKILNKKQTTVNPSTETQTTSPQPAHKPMKKSTKIILSIVAVLVVLFIAFYAWGSNRYSRNNQIDRIVYSLKNPQADMAKYVTTDNHNLQVTDKALKPTQKYYQQHQTAAYELGGDLRNTGYSGQESLVQSGRYFLLFPKYTLQLRAYTPQVKTNHADSTVLVNNQAVGKLDGEAGNYYKKLNPLFPGKYHIEVKSNVSGRKLSADSNINVWSNKTVNMNIRTATFSVKSVPDGNIYINDKKVGILDKNGEKNFKDYPITDNMVIYVTSAFKNQIIHSKTITDLPEIANEDSDYSDSSDDVTRDDDNDIVVHPAWKGLIDKDDAESTLKSDFNDPDEEDFINGVDNPDYQDLHKIDKGWDDDDKISDYDMDCDIVSIYPAPNNSSSVVYKINYTFEYENGSEKKQVMLFRGGLFRKKDDEQKIETIGKGKMISNKTYTD